MHSKDFNNFTEFLDTIIAQQTEYRNEFTYFSPNTPDGMILEFGVASGTTIRMIADAFPDRQVDGFDSWEGLPEDWRPGHPAGSFKCDIPVVPQNVTLHKGLFSETLPGFLENNPGAIAFIHLDADLYSSTAYVLEQVEDRLQDGTILVFDELHYPADNDNYKEHEYKAFAEFIERTGFKCVFLHQRYAYSYCFKLVR